MDDLEKAFDQTDTHSLSEIYRMTGKLLSDVAPHVTNQRLSKSCLDVGDKTQQMAIKIGNGEVQLTDIGDFEQIVSSEMLAAFEENWKERLHNDLVRYNEWI